MITKYHASIFPCYLERICYHILWKVIGSDFYVSRIKLLLLKVSQLITYFRLVLIKLIITYYTGIIYLFIYLLHWQEKIINLGNYHITFSVTTIMIVVRHGQKWCFDIHIRYTNIINGCLV